MTVLVTGSAGFIGFHTCTALLERGERVVGIDNLNDYYDVSLKKARLSKLDAHKGFSFHHGDITDDADIAEIERQNSKTTRLIHLAAQAGVRYSLENPHAYVQTNVVGQLNILELARRLDGLEHLVYASSSSVYGGNTDLPFAIRDRVDTPISLYAATKRMDELMGHCYSHLYRIPATGLRFFTVYGPWGRPDMAAYKFAKAIFDGQPISVFNSGDMKRDFTYVDDTVAGVIAALDKAPSDHDNAPPHRLYNIGNNHPEDLMRFIAIIEAATGRKAELQLEPMQPGDVRETYADISESERELGYSPNVKIDEGIPRFVEWFRSYYGY
jgi:UDP-glucuronate 4-epimerase